MPRRIDAGEVLAAVGGVLVFVSLYLSWFEDANGFESFEALDIALAVLAVATVWTAVAGTLALPSAPAPRTLPVLGIAILLVVAVQLIDPPPVFQGLDPDREVVAWLALAGGALVLLGGALRLAHISVTVSVGGRDVRRRVPAVDRRPGAAAPNVPDPEATLPIGATDPLDVDPPAPPREP